MYVHIIHTSYICISNMRTWIFARPVGIQLVSKCRRMHCTEIGALACVFFLSFSLSRARALSLSRARSLSLSRARALSLCLCVCLCVCVCFCVCVCVYRHALRRKWGVSMCWQTYVGVCHTLAYARCTLAYAGGRRCTEIGALVCWQAYLGARTHARTLDARTHTHIYAYVCMYVCMYVCIYVCMCIYVYTSFRTHAPREKPHAKRGVLGCRLASTATTCASSKALFKLY